MVNKKELLQEIEKKISTGEVRYVIGYAFDSCGLYTRPFFAQKKQDVQKLIFSPLCVNNLAMYLKDYDGEGKIGIVVKGCDSRSIIQLITEKRVLRENLFIIGISCGGAIDQKKLHTKYPEIRTRKDIDEKEDCYILTGNGENYRIPKKEMCLQKCLSCQYPTPLLYDILLGEKREPIGIEKYLDVKEIEEKTLDEKWKFWMTQFDRCIRCYACRNICPVCFCKECSAEQLRPQWLRRSVSLSENTVWHLTRALHVVGRCTACGECERVCPMNIPLMLLNKKMLKEIQELFGYTPGISINEKPLLASYKPDDPEEEARQVEE